MNATLSTPTRPTTDARVVAFTPPTATRYGTRERDFGVGYGKSSGYGSPRGYAANPWAGLHFRVA